MIDYSKLKLEERIIKDDSGMPVFKMLVPVDWRVELKKSPTFYRGYKYPYLLRVELWSPDNTCRIKYTSPCQLYENHNNPMAANTVDSYGNLNGSTKDLETRLEETAQNYFNNNDDFHDIKLIEQLFYKSNDEVGKKKYEEKLKSFETDNMHVISDFYYRGGIRKYSYFRKNTHRFYCTSLTIEATRHEIWYALPPAVVMSLRDPFMAQMAKSAFPHAHFNEGTNSWVYLPQFYTNTLLYGIFDMDCIETDREELYKKVYVPILNHGVTLTPELWADFKAVQNKKEAVRKEKREQAKEVAKIDREIREQRRQHQKETQDYLRKTQKEISDIRKSAYENQQRTQAKVREMWGDTLRGDTRFVDKYGDEHVIHTYDKYAYKSGDTYVTSDSPLDHSWDWEELEKKKY